METRNKGLIVLGIVILAIGSVASYYQATQIAPTGPYPTPGGFDATQAIYPYRDVGIIFLVVGVIFTALGVLLPLLKTQQREAS